MLFHTLTATVAAVAFVTIGTGATALAADRAEQDAPTIILSTEPQLRSPATAAGLAIATTVAAAGSGIALLSAGESGVLGGVGLSLLLAGVVVGPSVGHLYAGDLVHSAITIGLRTLTALGALVGAAGALDAGLDEDPNTSAEGWEVALLACGTATLALGLYNLIDAPFAARRQNERRARTARRVALAPFIAPAADRSTSYGAALVGTF